MSLKGASLGTVVLSINRAFPVMTRLELPANDRELVERSGDFQLSSATWSDAVQQMCEEYQVRPTRFLAGRRDSDGIGVMLVDNRDQNARVISDGRFVWSCTAGWIPGDCHVDPYVRIECFPPDIRAFLSTKINWLAFSSQNKTFEKVTEEAGSRFNLDSVWRFEKLREQLRRSEEFTVQVDASVVTAERVSCYSVPFGTRSKGMVMEDGRRLDVITGGRTVSWRELLPSVRFHPGILQGIDEIGTVAFIDCGEGITDYEYPFSIAAGKREMNGDVPGLFYVVPSVVDTEHRELAFKGLRLGSE